MLHADVGMVALLIVAPGDRRDFDEFPSLDLKFGNNSLHSANT